MQHHHPTTIIGAGLTGLTMACSLAENGIGVTLVEAGKLETLTARESDGRTCAISYGSAQIFEKLGLWQKMLEKAGPILDIRVTDGNSPLFLHYDHSLVGQNPMGYIIENHHLLTTLYNRAKALKNINILDSTKYKSITRDNYKVTIELENGDTIKSQLLIAADGKNSAARSSAGIKTTGWPYDQSGIVCTVKHAFPHNGVAVENFLPAGPFAILPMHNPHLSSIVWTEKTSVANLIMNMDDADFLEQLALRFDGYLGKLEVVGKRFCYPLSLTLARKYTATRLALIGDAAHAMHPIAGQGFNLGIRDIPVLTGLIVNAHRLGLDIGSENILAEYAKTRKFDNISLLAITDSLNRLFSNDIFPVKHMRRLGLATVNKINPLKKLFIKHASGTGYY